MACPNPCKNCDRKGLPILFTRYAAAYSAQDADIDALKKVQPMGNFQARPGGVEMKTALYNVRMLRPGYLYVRFVHPAYRAPQWWGFVVHPHGYLAQFTVSQPETAKPQPACEMEVRGANASMVWIPDAKNVTELHYVFHPDLIDFEHLIKEIEPKRDTYMQKFDVAAWANGTNSHKDACQPGQLNGLVVEFAALSDSLLRDAMEPQLYGLMGANAIERGWGDWEESVTTEGPAYTATGDYAGTTSETRPVKHKGASYSDAHGMRLRKMAEYLQQHKGAVVACDDAIGITQELGHLQAEAQMLYTHWQISAAVGHHKDVTNEWALQTAVAAKGLIELAEKGALAKVEAGFAESSQFKAPLPHDPDAAKQEAQRRAAARQANRSNRLADAKTEMQRACKELFDEAAAKDILLASEVEQKNASEAVARLGADQNQWLHCKQLLKAIDRYSAQDSRIDRPGGGASLSLELAQCLAGAGTHVAGRELLQTLDLWGDNLLSRLLCFNSKTLAAAAKDLGNATRPEQTTPEPEPEAAMADATGKVLKVISGRFGLGDKALAFIEHAQGDDAPAMLRKAAWAGHVSSIMSARAMSGVNSLPRSAMEARMVQHLAHAAMTTLGKTAQREIDALTTDVQENAKRIALRAKKLQAAAEPATHTGKTSTLERARSAAPGTRAAMLGAMLDLFGAVVKGNQLGTKLDGRTAFDLAGQFVQGLGNLYDWRAKVYEETIYKGVRGADLYKYKSLQQGLDAIKTAQLKSLRLTAFKFLAPAAMASAVLDGIDALKSFKRGSDPLAFAQLVSVFGTAFTIAGAGAGVLAATTSAAAAAFWTTVGVSLGLAGAFITIVATVAVLVLEEEKWKDWLRDSPLSLKRRGQKPLHDDLADTLQQLANAQSEFQRG